MRSGALAALAIFALAGPVHASDAAAGGLGDRLDAALAARSLRGAKVAALVVARDDGRTLYARDPDRALVPASNMKILTSMATLSAFGPTHRFTTEIFVDAPPDAEGAVDWITIRGSDPALTSEEVWRLAADLRRLGLRQVRVGMRVDDSAFDGERWHPAWGKVSARAYHAPVGALSVNYGAFAVEVVGGDEAGDPVRVNLDPPTPFFQLSNRARTGKRRSRTSLVVDRAGSNGIENVVISGVVPAGSEPKIYYRSVRSPARYAASVIRDQLRANGIIVASQTLEGPVLEPALPLLSFEGKSVAEIVRLLMKYSNNTIAESLVKALGARATGLPGSWKTGVPAMRAELVGMGIDADSLTIVDGSGLSDSNRVTPRSLVQALRIAERSFRFGPELLSSLPIAGADGTLEDRAEAAANRVRAKTGLLTRVTALSGLAEREDGSQVIFSVLVNGYRGSDEGAMAALDRFVAELVNGI
jgi:D-alanyl-D-alanine carboxypeptidase/D-alanyl-D-alanine-endopeptidase (penicillin-binding protein 4)